MSGKLAKPIFIISSLLIAAASATAYLPEMASMQRTLPGISIGLSVLLLIVAALLDNKAGSTSSDDSQDTPGLEPVATAARPELAAIPEQSGEVQVVQLLAALQEKGRFLDFVMDDIKAYPDAQVAAAARVVHQGCSNAINTHLSIEPIESTAENQSLSLSPEFERAEYALTGKIGGEPPFSGTLIHKGWKTTKINLPKVTGERANSKGAHVIAPAQVELK